MPKAFHSLFRHCKQLRDPHQNPWQASRRGSGRMSIQRGGFAAPHFLGIAND